MSYIVLDLEFTDTCSYKKKYLKASSGNRMGKEIIQIGAVKLSDDWKISEKLLLNVCPIVGKYVDKNVEKMTGLTYSFLQRCGMAFPEAYEKLRAFIGEEDGIIFTWDDSDQIVLDDNIACWDLQEEAYQFLDLQCIVGQTCYPGEARKSVMDVMSDLKLRGAGSAHNALHDAWNEALILKSLENLDEVLQTYNPYYFQCGMINDPLRYQIIPVEDEKMVERYIRKRKICDFRFSGEERLIFSSFKRGENTIKVWMDQEKYYSETIKPLKNKPILVAYLKECGEEELEKLGQWYLKSEERKKVKRNGTTPTKRRGGRF